MKAVYPVTRHNAAWFGQLATLFAKVGPQREHGLVLVACPAALGAAQTFAESVRRLFGSCEVYAATTEIGKTTAERNRLFKEAVALLAKHKNTSPWIWMENAYPVDREWLAMLDEEWDRKPSDRHFVGCIETAYRETPEHLFVEMGPYMRFGIYPPDFDRVVPEYRYCENVPFEVDLRGCIAYRCQESKLLATLWASVDYEKVGDGSVAGKQSPEFEPAIRANEKTRIKTAGLAALHGCRDASLGMLLIRSDWTDTKYTPRKRTAAESDALQRAKETIAALTERVSSLQARLDAYEEAARKMPAVEKVGGSVLDEIVIEQSPPPVQQAPVRKTDGPGEAIQYADCAVMSNSPAYTPQAPSVPVPPEESPVQVEPAQPETPAPRRRGRPPKNRAAA